MPDSGSKQIRKALLALVLSLSLLVMSNADASELSPVPTDSWHYDELDWVLLNPPTKSEFHVSSRPFIRADILSIIPESYSDQTPQISWKADKLKYGMARDYWLRSEDHKQGGGGVDVRLRSTPYFRSEYSDTLKPSYRVGFLQEVDVLLSDKLSLLIRGRLEDEGDKDPQFRGRRWEDKLTGYFDYGVVTFRSGGLTLQLGRSFRIWGAGDTDRLLISGNSPAFDQLYADFRYKRVMFQTFTARITDYYVDTDTTVARYFAGHRISFKPRRNIEIGLSETVLYGRRGTGIEWYYLNPFLPYYWEQYNNVADDNIYMGADIIWWPFRNTRIYGELMMDDFQIDFVTEPHQIGFDIGFSRLGIFSLDLLRIDFQYTQIRNYVYGQRLTYNVYTNDAEVIGSSLGPDTDRFRYKVSLALTRDLTVSAGGHFARKGEGRITDPQDVALPRHEEFPSGVVQKSWTNSVVLDLLLGNWLDARAEAGYLDVENHGNSEQSLHSPFFKVDLRYNLEGWLGL